MIDNASNITQPVNDDEEEEEIMINSYSVLFMEISRVKREND